MVAKTFDCFPFSRHPMCPNQFLKEGEKDKKVIVNQFFGIIILFFSFYPKQNLKWTELVWGKNVRLCVDSSTHILYNIHIINSNMKIALRQHSFS